VKNWFQICGKRINLYITTPWRAARDLDTRSLLDVNWCQFFHAYLIHTELLDADGGVLAAATFPPWIMHEAGGCAR
jgi:hypothetical protein